MKKPQKSLLSIVLTVMMILLFSNASVITAMAAPKFVRLYVDTAIKSESSNATRATIKKKYVASGYKVLFEGAETMKEGTPQLYSLIMTSPSMDIITSYTFNEEGKIAAYTERVINGKTALFEKNVSIITKMAGSVNGEGVIEMNSEDSYVVDGAILPVNDSITLMYIRYLDPFTPQSHLIFKITFLNNMPSFDDEGGEYDDEESYEDAAG